MTTATSTGNHGVPPSGVLTISPNSVASKPTGQQQTFTVTATDASGIALTNLPMTLAIVGPNGQQLIGTTNAAGQVTFSYTGAYPGTDTVQAIGWVSGIAAYSAQVSVPWTPGTPPQPAAPLSVPGWLGGPANQSSVSGLVPITLASGITLQTGTITYWPADDSSAVTTLATNVHGSGGATLATLDTTTLANGSYIISLSGTNSSGVQVNSGILITVVGEYKPGRVRFSVTDLTVPVTGLPITIGRTYDSLERGRSGDFGYGWSLDVGSPRVKTDQAHNVTLTQPGGRRVTFYFTPRSVGGIFGFLLQPAYTAEPGVYGSLTANGCSLMVSSGGQYVCFLDNPTYNPSIYTYTDPYGRIFTMDATGSLRSISDLNNNTLTFGANGITSSAGGLNVPFVRDSQGRITRITDPEGNVYDYTYSASGDLNEVHLPSTPPPISYTYDTSHLLTSAVDPRGNSMISASYYPDGRLKSETDAVGNTVTYAYNLATNTTTVTNPDGGTVVSTYNSAGNLVKEIDPLGRITTTTYSSNQNKLSETNGLGQTTTYTYDGQGNQTSVTNPLGKIDSTTYNQYKGPTSHTDPLGNRQNIAYDTRFNPANGSDSLGLIGGYTWDSNGNLQARTDGNNQVTSFTYTPEGNVQREVDPLGGATSFTYDQLGRKLTGTDSLNNVTRYSYDALGRLLTVTDPTNHVTSYSYDANGNRTAIHDGAGRQTTFVYDAANRLTRANYPDGTNTQYTYDFRGNLIDETDQSGRVTHHQYNRAGQLISVTYAQGTSYAGTVQYSYDAAGRKISETDALGHTTTYAYDAAGRRASVTDPLSHTTTTTYDAAGRPASVTDANGHATTYTYDARSRLTKITFADGTTIQQSYDAANNELSRTDQVGKTTQFAYDALQRLLKVTDALGQPTSYTYDALGHRLSQTDANGHTTTFEYDPLGRQTKRVLPQGMAATYIYDAVGNLASATNFSGKTTTYTYDAMDRLTGKLPDPSLGQPSVAYTYTPTGQRASMTDASGTTTYTYDQRDRLGVKATPQGTLTYTYDAAGNLLSMQSNHTDGVSGSYTYDNANRLKTVVDDRLASGTTNYTYDAAGNLANNLYPNGVQSAYSYNNVNRLTNLVVSKTANLASYAYTLGPAGNRLAVTELSGRTVNYAYDALYRLTNETITGAPVADNGAISYTYDAVGNRLSRTSTLAAVPSDTSTYDSNDRRTGDTYDANGDLIASGGTTYAYDFEDRLTSVNGGAVAVVYDGDGNRVAETAGGVTTRYLIDDLNPSGRAQVVEEVVGGAVQRAYTYGHALISQRQLLGGIWTASFYGYDGHGNVRFLTDSAGAVSDTYDFDAFGNLIRATGSTPNNYLFTGEQRDPNIGFYYLRARYYSPDQGRFATMDTYDGRIFEPLTLHKYLYTHGDPVNNIDPSGRQAIAQQAITYNFTILLTLARAAAAAAVIVCTANWTFGEIASNLSPEFLRNPPRIPCLFTAEITLYRGYNGKKVGRSDFRIDEGFFYGGLSVNEVPSPNHTNNLAFHVRYIFPKIPFLTNGVVLDLPGASARYTPILDIGGLNFDFGHWSMMFGGLGVDEIKDLLTKFGRGGL